MRLFPDFDDNLRQAFRQETELFFESIMREDRSVLDLLRANYTFVNERLAKHYGIPNVYGSRFRRITFDKDSERGGLLRHCYRGYQSESETDCHSAHKTSKCAPSS